VPHLHGTLGALTDDGKSFRQYVIQAFTLRNASSKLICFSAQLFVAEGFVFSFQRIDEHHSFAVLLDQAVVATAENLGQKIDRHVDPSLNLPKMQRTARKSCLKVDSKVHAHKAQVNATF
jgi:hypothetical protein